LHTVRRIFPVPGNYVPVLIGGVAEVSLSRKKGVAVPRGLNADNRKAVLGIGIDDMPHGNGVILEIKSVLFTDKGRGAHSIFPDALRKVLLLVQGGKAVLSDKLLVPHTDKDIERKTATAMPAYGIKPFRNGPFDKVRAVKINGHRLVTLQTLYNKFLHNVPYC
jgi:hypothetical protein